MDGYPKARVPMRKIKSCTTFEDVVAGSIRAADRKGDAIADAFASGMPKGSKAYHYHYAQAWNLRKRLLAIAMDVPQLENPEENRVATEPGTKKPRKFE